LTRFDEKWIGEGLLLHKILLRSVILDENIVGYLATSEKGGFSRNNQQDATL